MKWEEKKIQHPPPPPEFFFYTKFIFNVGNRMKREENINIEKKIIIFFFQ